MIALAYLMSRNRSAIRWKGVVWGLGVQLVFALLILKTGPGQAFFDLMNTGIIKLMECQTEGAEFVFSKLALPPDREGSMGFFFAFQVLTTIIFFSSLMSILYYLGVMQFIVLLLSKAMYKILGTSGAETLAATANIFIGQTEAPLLVRPYVKDMTQSELLAIMVAGLATVAGGIMGAYVSLLKGFFPDIAGHLMAKSVMSAPAALVIAKILIPEEEHPRTAGKISIEYHDPNANVLEAAASGAEIGLKLSLNVAAMLVAFMSVLALVNGMIGWAGALAGWDNLTLQGILAYGFAPLAWVMGAPWQDCLILGELIGEKTALNELVAYSHMGQLLVQDASALSSRSIMIASYALCGFANILSIGISIGGIGAIAPTRKSDLARLGWLALIGGSLASFLTAAVAGVIVS